MNSLKNIVKKQFKMFKVNVRAPNVQNWENAKIGTLIVSRLQIIRISDSRDFGTTSPYVLVPIVRNPN